MSVGEPPAEARELYDVVRAAQQAGVEAVGPGVACEDVDRAARRVIDEAGYGDRFVHRTGHGIGIEFHGPPYIVAGETLPLRPACASRSSPASTCDLQVVA